MSRFLPALVTQTVQAGVGLALHLVAARHFGDAGLGLFAAMYGATVVAGAVAVGLVADPLTMLVPRVSTRAVACSTTLAAAGAALVSTAVGLALAGPGAAAVLAATGATVAAAEVARRVLMIAGRSALLALAELAAGTGTCAVALRWSPTVESLLGALTLGRLVVIAAAAQSIIRRHPLSRCNGRRTPLRSALGEVWRIGRWRLVQHASRPTMWAAVRLAAVATIGAAEWGRVEAARVTVAPAVLLANAAGVSLLVTDSSDPRASPERWRRVRRRARRTGLLQATCIAALLVAGAVLGTNGTGSAPRRLLATGSDRTELVALIGWSALAIAIGVTTPSGIVTAVGGGHARVAIVRLAEVAATFTSVMVVLAVSPAAHAIPWMAAGWTIIAAVQLDRWARPSVAAGANDTSDHASAEDRPP